jgi:ribosomal protein S6--L-glutamate ligase
VRARLREAYEKCKNAPLYSYPREVLSVNELPTPLILGWQEWVALPDLGLPALKAKIDTGARTSALHTHQIEPYGSAERPMVRFTVRPDPDREDLQIEAHAAIIDQREVTSSNGERELRFVIETRLKLGEWEWPIEITLTNRERMAYRMLLGRQAIRPNVLVAPDAKFRQPLLGYELYGG